MAAIDQLNSLAGLLQTVQGNEQTTKTKQKGTQTTQTKISDAGVNKLISDILAGPGGVRSIGGAARSSGLYNSSTEDMLLGDLYSRAAVSAELARSPTVQTTDMTTTATAGAEGIGLGGLGGAIALGQAGKLLFGKGGEQGLLSGVGEAVSGFFGGGAGAGATQAVTGATLGNAAQTIGPEIVKMGGLASAGGAAAGGAAAGTAAATSGAAGLGFNAATALPLGGSFLSGLLGGKDAATDPANLGMSAIAGAAALGPVGLIAAPLAAVAGGFLSDLSIVCTALHRKGLITKHLHKGGEHYFSTVPVVTKVGYWLWGVPVARKIDANSVFWILLTLPVVKSYLRFVSGPRTLLSCFAHPLGGLAYYLGEPICKALGHAVLYWETKTKRYN